MYTNMYTSLFIILYYTTYTAYNPHHPHRGAVRGRRGQGQNNRLRRAHGRTTRYVYIYILIIAHNK